ncbi:MAG: glucose-6-phosphate dehydrogenase assembly protein OpcA [Thermoleophilia bacterium]
MGGSGVSRPRSAAEEGLEFALGSSRRTTAHRAEEELGTLWQAAGAEAEARGGPGVVRVRELNLIVRASSRDVSDRVGEVAGHIAGCHPARVIVILEESPGRGGGKELEAWITAACFRSREGDRQICWEQVNILAGGADPVQVQAATASLLIPDIPVMLWWPGELRTDRPLFQGLIELSQRLIFDSSDCRDLRGDWHGVREALRAKGRTWSVEDISWRRLGPWRELVAEPFDDPVRLPFLSQIEEIRIAYEAGSTIEPGVGSAGSPVARALLLAGWLGSRLGWLPEGRGWTKSGDDLVGYFRPVEGGRSVRLRLVPAYDSPCTFGGVVEFEMLAADELGGNRRSLLVSRHEQACVCASWYWSAGQQELVRTLEMPVPEEDRLLCEALEPGPPDPLYEEAFSVATGLAVLPGGRLLEGGGEG